MSALDDLIDGEIESQDRWNDKKMLYEAKKELAALRNPWQPISTAPKDGTNVFLLANGCAYNGFYNIDARVLKVGWYATGRYPISPTHYMLIPELP